MIKNDLCSADHPLVKDAPRQCSVCAAPLCLRKQVVNLALGNAEQMMCLLCLAQDNDQDPAEMLFDLMSYVKQRDCFAKEWRRYTDVTYCPDQTGCFASVCFEIDGKS